MHILPVRIYYEDTDFSGFVYHARYLHFFERGRTEFLRACGIHHRTLHEAEGGPFGFVVRRMAIDYHAPARMDDDVVVETRIHALSGARITMAQRLMRGEMCLTEAEVEIAFLAQGRAARLPPDLRAKLHAVSA
jgi:acyl-CoA thioester hydrolase